MFLTSKCTKMPLAAGLRGILQVCARLRSWIKAEKHGGKRRQEERKWKGREEEGEGKGKKRERVEVWTTPNAKSYVS